MTFRNEGLNRSVETVNDVALTSAGASATASSYGSFAGTTARPENAIDGDHGTKWGGTQGAGDWLQIELEQKYPISQIHVDNGYHTLTYDIEVSKEGSTWKTVVDAYQSPGDHYIDDPTNNNEIFHLDGERARYVKITIRDTNAPFSHIWQAIIDEVTVVPSGDYETTTTTSTTTTTTPPDTTTSTTTTPKAKEPLSLENAQLNRTVTVGENQYRILQYIPNADPIDQFAVTTLEYELVNPDTARDALITDIWAQQPYLVDWEAELQEAKNKETSYQIGETLNRAADFGIEALATYALATVSGPAAIPVAIDLLESSINWSYETIATPYEEGFSKITVSCKTTQWVDQQVQDIHTSAEIPEKSLALVSATEEAVGKLQSLKTVGQNAQTIYQTFRASRNLGASGIGALKTSLSAGALNPAVRTASYNFILGTLVGRGVEETVSGFEKNAKFEAAGKAYHSARIPIIREIIYMVDKARNGELSPPQIWRLQSYKALYYNMSAVAYKLMAKYVDALDEGLFGGAWDFILNSEETARALQERSSSYQDIAGHELAVHGAGRNTATERAASSLNAKIHGGDHDA